MEADKTYEFNVNFSNFAGKSGSETISFQTDNQGNEVYVSGSCRSCEEKCSVCQDSIGNCTECTDSVNRKVEDLCDCPNGFIDHYNTHDNTFVCTSCTLAIIDI